MKFFTTIFLFATIFVVASNAGSPAVGEPNVCDVVAQVSFEFTSFTSNLLRLYILNLPRSDESSEEKLNGLVDVVGRNADVPEEDKIILENLINGEFEGRSLADQLTRANIWDCFVSIFTGSLSGVMAY